LPIVETARVSFNAGTEELSGFSQFLRPTFSPQDFPRSILYSEFSARMYILHPVEIKEIRPFLASR